MRVLLSTATPRPPPARPPALTDAHTPCTYTVLTLVITARMPKVVEEEESAGNEAARKRALTAPKTMLSYFKKAENSATQSASAFQSLAQQQVSRNRIACLLFYHLTLVVRTAEAKHGVIELVVLFQMI